MGHVSAACRPVRHASLCAHLFVRCPIPCAIDCAMRCWSSFIKLILVCVIAHLLGDLVSSQEARRAQTLIGYSYPPHIDEYLFFIIYYIFKTNLPQYALEVYGGPARAEKGGQRAQSITEPRRVAQSPRRAAQSHIEPHRAAQSLRRA